MYSVSRRGIWHMGESDPIFLPLRSVYIVPLRATRAHSLTRSPSIIPMWKSPPLVYPYVGAGISVSNPLLSISFCIPPIELFPTLASITSHRAFIAGFPKPAFPVAPYPQFLPCGLYSLIPCHQYFPYFYWPPPVRGEGIRPSPPPNIAR